MRNIWRLEINKGFQPRTRKLRVLNKGNKAQKWVQASQTVEERGDGRPPRDGSRIGW